METTTTPHAVTALVAALGLPLTCQGYTPTERPYWYEPGLPFARLDGRDTCPTGYNGLLGIWQFAHFTHNLMAPRFPLGTVVNMAPVYGREALTVGKVYAYCPNIGAGPAERWQAGRLAFIGGNYLELTQDNCATGLIWPLRPTVGQETWDVQEITHYVSYPAL